MIKAELLNRIANQVKCADDLVLRIENKITYCASIGNKSTVEVVPKEPDFTRLKNALADAGYKVDETETQEGHYMPGVLFKISWD